MRIAELYASRQGEGLLTGTQSVFVRASGCNLRCWFCDTPFASWTPEGEDLSVDKIAAQVQLLNCKHVVLTGGEPMLFAELVPLSELLQSAGCHITIETAGTLDLPVACDLMSLSPKLAGSGPTVAQDRRWSVRHDRSRHRPEVIRRLLRDYQYQVKFVIDSPADCRAVEAYLLDCPTIDRQRVLLMPQGTDSVELAQRGQWLQAYCQTQGFVFCPRMQIQWFGLARGT